MGLQLIQQHIIGTFISRKNTAKKALSQKMAEVPAVFAPESKQANEDTTRDSRQSGIIPTAAWKRRLVDEFKPHKEFSVRVFGSMFFPKLGLFHSHCESV